MLNDTEKEILQYIQVTENYISGEALSNICRVSLSTVRRSIDNLNDFLSDHGCWIETRKSAGYYLTYEDEEAEFYIYSLCKEFRQFRYIHYSDHEMAYILIKIIIASPRPVTIEQLMDTLFCSKSTIIRSLENVAAILDNFHLELHTKRNTGLSIEGTEWSKRICMIFIRKISIHNADMHRFDDQSFQNLFRSNNRRDMETRKKMFRIISEYEGFELSGINIPKIMDFIDVSHNRRRYVNELGFTEGQLHAAKNLRTYEIARKIYELFPDTPGNEPSEMDYIALSALLISCINLSSSAAIPHHEFMKIRSEVHEAVSFILQYHDISRHLDAVFYEDFSCYYYMLRQRKRFSIPRDAEELTQSLRMGLHSDDICSYFALFFELKYNIRLNENDLTDLYFIVHATFVRNRSNYIGLKIAVASRYGLYYSRCYKELLLRYYSPYIRSIDCMEYSRLANESGKYDLIFSDDQAHYPLADHQIGLDFQMQYSLQKMPPMEKYLKEKLDNASLEIFTKENFHITDFASKEEVYDEIFRYCQPYVENKADFLKDLNHKNSILSFERNNSMVFISPLAYQMEKPLVEIFVNRQPLLWNREQCSVFVFYHIADGTEENIDATYRILRALLHAPKEFINTLNEKTYDDVINYFRNIPFFSF